MMICISSEGDNLDSFLADRFEKAKFFLFIEKDCLHFKAVPAGKKDGRLVFLVTQNRPDILITGNINPDNFDFLKASGIKIYSGVFGLTVREALARFKRGELEETGEASGAAKGRLL